MSAERESLRAEIARAELYRSAVMSAPVGIMCASHESGEYVFSNPAHAALLGYTPEEIVSADPHERWIQVTHPEDYEREHREFERLAKGTISRFESDRRCVRGDGKIRWARVTVVALRDAEGRLAHILVYFVDIHEQRMLVEARERLEVQLRQAQKMESLGRLAGGVAHDFNNRLVIIMGYAEVLKNRLPSGSPEAQQAEQVITSAQRAADLTRQLLAYSRRQVLKPRAFDLNEGVDGMRRMLERLIGDHIQLVTRLGARRPVFCDPGQIEQVVLNLAINARDAMPHGGHLVLETRDVSIGAAADVNLPAGDYVALIVQDTGAGIPERILPRIFEPFFTTKEVGRGTGLGLATVDGIVRQSGGAIHVESQPGAGSRFSVLLPPAQAKESAPAPRPREEAREPACSFETLLICDDDDGVRELLVDVLKIRSYNVLEARNGNHALEVARAHDSAIDLLITDLVMPERSGSELAAELRKTRPGLKVLFVSGYTDDEKLLSGALDPGTHFLAKPFLPGELVRAVRAIITGRSPSMPARPLG